MAGIGSNQDFSSCSRGLNSPAKEHRLITAGTAVTFADENIPRALFITGPGSVATEDINGVAVTYSFLASCSFPFGPKKILVATDVDVVAWW